jgi:hypothetical protein
MAFKLSTGMRNHLMATDDFAAGVNGGLIKIYGSPTSQAAADALIPATADAALGSATLLCIVSVSGGGTGLNMDTTPSSGVLTKASAEAWYGTNVASGYSSFYRFAPIADDGTLSTTAKRCQGTVGILGTDLIVASAYLTLGQQQRIDSYAIGIPSE